MTQKKDYSTHDFKKVSLYLEEASKVSRSLREDMSDPDVLDSTIDIIVNRKYKELKKRYGSKSITALLNLHISNEEYEECSEIIKATK